MIETLSITILKLKNNKLKKELPEFYDLKNVIENNDWHHRDSVFNHTLCVLINLKKLFKKYDKKLNKHLNKKINKYSRKELLFLGALFHDIAKKETIIKKKEVTYCPGHEYKGAIKAKKILKRFNLSIKEKQFVIDIIKNHGLTHTLPAVNSKSYRDFRKKYRRFFLELIVLAMADMLGTQLKNKNPKEFSMRYSFYKKIIGK